MGKQIKRSGRSSSSGKTRGQFDYRLMDDFYDKSLSEHTRRAYRRVVREFFTAHRKKHPSEINAKQAQAWRDALIRKRQKPATINFKLSVVRSFFEYLRLGGVVTHKTRLVPPYERSGVNCVAAGRSLPTRKEFARCRR